MFRFRVWSATAAWLVIAIAGTSIQATGHGRTLVVTMTNDQSANQIKVYDAESHALLQTLSTHGKGGVGPMSDDDGEYARKPRLHRYPSTRSCASVRVSASASRH